MKRLGIKQGNPREKNGMVGAFCRTYSVYRAIEKFLNNVYVQSRDKNRYTYAKGTTTGGLVIYDDGDFAFSHHGTDPAGGRRCNAFDLVRIHMFGKLDEEVTEGTPVVKLPSYEAMLNLCRDDEEVRHTLGMERLINASEDLNISDEADEEDTEWLKQMDVDKKGNCRPTIANLVLILDNDPNLKEKIGLNEFSNMTMKTGSLPWHELINKSEGDLWQDSDDASLRFYIEKTMDEYILRYK